MAYQEPKECADHTCSYYQHYLAYGPADLTHEGFHAAEQRCLEAQQAVDDWMEAHPGKDPTRACPMLRVAEKWEQRVRA